jgi:hypothetical protein
MLCSLVVMAEDWKPEEYRDKARFLAAFPNFVEWPEDAFPSASAPLFICVFGDFSFGSSLAELTRGVVVRQRRLEVRWTRKEQELRSCHIVFVSRSEGRRYGQILKSLQGASVLTVGETSGFISNGGGIEFAFESDKLQFAVNMIAAEDARLKISSNMLALARHVVRPEAEKNFSLGLRN